MLSIINEVSFLHYADNIPDSEKPFTCEREYRPIFARDLSSPYLSVLCTISTWPHSLSSHHHSPHTTYINLLNTRAVGSLASSLVRSINVRIILLMRTRPLPSLNTYATILLHHPLVVCLVGRWNENNRETGAPTSTPPPSSVRPTSQFPIPHRAAPPDRPILCLIVCGMRYKTRPGLSYHYNHSHKDRDKSIPLGGYPTAAAGQSGDDSASYHEEASLTPPSTPGAGGGDAAAGAGGGSGVADGGPGARERTNERSGPAAG